MKPFDKYCSTLSDEALMAACSRIRHVALDMDGTIYMGSTLFPAPSPSWRCSGRKASATRS